MSWTSHCWIKTTRQKVTVHTTAEHDKPTIMRHIALLLMTVFVIVGGTNPPNCAVGMAEKRRENEAMICPEPIIAHFHLEPITVPEAQRRKSSAIYQEMYPYYSKGVQWKEGNTEKLPTCTKNSDCNWVDTNDYRGICYPARSFLSTNLIKDVKFCFAAKAFDQSEYYLDPNGVGLKHCEKSADCADSENMGGGSYDPWYCNKRQGIYDLSDKPVKGVCMKAKICGHLGKPNVMYASRPAQGSNCDIDDHSSCVGAGIAAVDTSRNYTSRCIKHTQYQDTNLCCQYYECVAGEPTMENGNAICDLLVSDAMRYDSNPLHHLPYYKDGTTFEKDSGKDLPTCTTNVDCEYLNSANGSDSKTGYCHSARSNKTNLVVKDKKFCFVVGFGKFYYVDPEDVGLKFCNSHADCFNQTYSYSSYNHWRCTTNAGFAESGNKLTGVCTENTGCEKAGSITFPLGSLTVNGTECNSDQSCIGAGVASVDTLNDYTSKCGPRFPVCCQYLMPSCSFGFNYRPRTSCSSDSDCTKLAKHKELVCDTEHKICCDNSAPNYLKGISFKHLVKILSNQQKLDNFFGEMDLDLVDKFKKDFTLGFDENAIEAILDVHNGLRDSVSNGSFSARGKQLPAAKNLIPLKWNKSFEGHAKAVAVKSCIQKVEKYNVEVLEVELPQTLAKDPKEYGIEAVQKWESKLSNKFSFMRDDSEMIANPHGDSVLQLIQDNVSEVGCAYSKCLTYSSRVTPIVACYYGATSDQHHVYQIAE